MSKKRQYTKALLFIIGLLVIWGTTMQSAQAQLRIASPQNVGNIINCYVGGNTPYSLIPLKPKLQFQANEEVLQGILDKITPHTELVNPIEIVAVENAVNAEACPSDGGKNYIAFKTEWIQGLYNETNNEWAIYAVIAHEIGHFALGHDKVAYSSELEKQADEYAGTVLSMMGASLEDTLSAFRSKKIQGIPGGNYPAIDERIAAAKKGWEIVYNLNKALASKKLNDIVNYATEIIKFHPYNGYYYHYRSQAKYELGYYAGTLEDCQTAIKFNKTIIWAYNICGAAKSKQGDYKQAIAFYNEAIEKDENNSEIAQIYTNRGEARYKLGDRTGAISDYKKAARWGNPFAQNVLRSLGEGW